MLCRRWSVGKYRIKLIAFVGKINVRIFVLSSNCRNMIKGNNVPHIYSDGSLCLFYPKYKECDYNEPWVNTLLPWISL